MRACYYNFIIFDLINYKMYFTITILILLYILVYIENYNQSMQVVLKINVMFLLNYERRIK